MAQEKHRGAPKRQQKKPSHVAKEKAARRQAGRIPAQTSAPSRPAES